MIGDFNDMASSSEKIGGRPWPINWILGFQETLSDCRLQDIEMSGYQYTWERSRVMLMWMVERLDQVTFTIDWMEHFSEARVKNIVTSELDHYALLLHCVAVTVNTKPPFNFENWWVDIPSCREIVSRCWADANIPSIQGKLDKCALELGDGVEVNMGILKEN